MDDGLPAGPIGVIVGSVFQVRSSHCVAAGVAVLALFATACGGQQASNIGAVLRRRRDRPVAITPIRHLFRAIRHLFRAG
jgi:hypothetical protein